MNDQATFGATIRAYRLGYHKMEGVGFVRCRASDRPPYFIDVAPLDVKAGDLFKGSGEHLRWWEGDSRVIEETIRDHFPEPCRKVTTLKLDDNGEVMP